jgi:hypothetical protein
LPPAEHAQLRVSATLSRGAICRVAAATTVLNTGLTADVRTVIAH